MIEGVLLSSIRDICGLFASWFLSGGSRLRVSARQGRFPEL